MSLSRSRRLSSGVEQALAGCRCETPEPDATVRLLLLFTPGEKESDVVAAGPVTRAQRTAQGREQQICVCEIRSRWGIVLPDARVAAVGAPRHVC